MVWFGDPFPFLSPNLGPQEATCRGMFIDAHIREQAGAELSQAQPY